MIYAYAVQQPEYDWYMQTDKDSLVSVKKIYEKFGSTTYLLWPQFRTITCCDLLFISLMFQNQYCFNEHHQVILI